MNRDLCPHCKRSIHEQDYFYVCRNDNGYMRLVKTEHATRKALKQGWKVFVVKFENLEEIAAEVSDE